MRLASLLSFACLFIGACRAADTAKPDTAQASPTYATSAANLPIAQYLGSDDATGHRVSELLRDAGIQSSAGGSLGYSVWVDGPNREKARQVLIAAAGSECLPVTVFDDAGNSIANARPSRCP